MNALLQQFIVESEDGLERIAGGLLALEKNSGDSALIDELFRLVHTLKGNAGLFELPELTRVLHAAEDLMDDVRAGRLAYASGLADALFEAMDFVQIIVGELAGGVSSTAAHAGEAARLSERLRALRPARETGAATDAAPRVGTGADLTRVPAALIAKWRADGGALIHIDYRPERDCFFKGEDPFYLMRQVPEAQWMAVEALEPWAAAAELDAYACNLRFVAVSRAARPVVEQLFRYVSEQVVLTDLDAARLDASPPVSAAAPPEAEDGEDLLSVLDAQAAIVGGYGGETDTGRLRAAFSALAGWCAYRGDAAASAALEGCANDGAPDPERLARWIEAQRAGLSAADPAGQGIEPAAGAPAAGVPVTGTASTDADAGRAGEEGDAAKDGRAAVGEAAHGNRVLKIDQAKIDRLMNLIGEMVVAKNALPYLASRAEEHFGIREMSREIKSHYGVINRIAEEMQDAIMQVRLMPVSTVLQRFPRLVRDLSRKLGKQVELVMSGEDTEADKNVVEALADPLIHILRNSLDHGLETPEARLAAGKPAAGTITIQARQESDRVVIDVRDDGRGIDPAAVKRKAYERGLIDEEALERLSDEEAIQLVFLPGFSTAAAVSDLSGRGVGMDVVRSAIERLHGGVKLSSRPGRGTLVRLSLPLSMAVTNVMIVETADQRFGLPIESVVETVRVHPSLIRDIKQRQAMVRRGRLIPLVSLNRALNLDIGQRTNIDGEYAVLVVRAFGEQLGLIVDDFHETIDILLKPLDGVLADLRVYAGTALLGDGSVLMVLNPREVF